MDKNAIKKYAVWARKELIARVTQKAEQYEITEKKTTPADADSIGGRVLTAAEKKQRQALIAKINQDGFEQVMEEVAYTWFNRFTALRFMEVNNYLPSHTRVFTNENGEFKPQILADAIQLDLEGLDMDKVFELKDANKTEELYKYLLITQCNALSSVLPGMFQKIEDFTELLLPDYLLREGSTIERLVAEIPEDNFDVNNEHGQIEIIGWLYQYYISEKHEEVVDPLHGKIIKKEEVPAATQLFTTDWVVRYLIDNSVGRYWIERNPNSKLADKLTYFVKSKNGEINTVNEKVVPQDITTLDPCVGSGHFLVYAFDVLVKIYVEYGYSERDAAAEIVKNNLFGLDIDGRATQLAYFSIMMKARQYDRRFFTRGIQPNVYEITESNNTDKHSIEHFCGGDTTLKKDVEALIDALKDAKEYGSILQIPSVDFEKIDERLAQLSSEISIYNTYLFGDFQTLIRPAEIMKRRYAVVATNPPYLNKFDSKLKDFINANYKEYSGDLFSVFMYRNFNFCNKNGYTAFMTPNSWTAAKLYEKLRGYILDIKSITTLIQMAKGAFFKEATVDICAFVIGNYSEDRYGQYIRLDGFKGDMDYQRIKAEEAIKNPFCGYYFETKSREFDAVPGRPLAYWLPESALEAFKKGSIGEVAETKQGFKTGNNDYFLRLWYEVDIMKLYMGKGKDKKKWFPCNKGGNFRKWYGNKEYAVNWENDGFQLINYKDKNGKQLSRPQNLSYNFREALTWSTLSSGPISFRYSDSNMMFESKGSGCFPKKSDLDLFIMQGFLNSNVTMYYLAALAPTVDYSEGSVLKLPYWEIIDRKDFISNMVKENIDLAKKDWDSFETSWDFQSHPLVPMACERQEQLSSGMNSAEKNKVIMLLSERYRQWEQDCEYRFFKLKKNEEELNRIFIDIYGLQEELTPEVEDRDVTVRKADLGRDIRSFISFAVGCMFGRYSLAVEGLVYAGGGWPPLDKAIRVRERLFPEADPNICSWMDAYGEFCPDIDNIIPICDDEYFKDDIVGRFVEFVKTVYGEDTLDENLKFIADALGGKGQPKDVIRTYFLNDFYKDHCKIYQKRPIYWLFDSGKKNGFKALIYMHRYQPDTIARIRTDYVHEQQSRYRTAMADLEKRIDNAAAGERVKLNKELNKLQAQVEEIRVYEEKIHHLADQMISIDLDDGVKVNYAKFQDVLAKIK